MKHPVRSTIVILLFGMLILSVANCASQEAKSTEQLLAAAGFQVRYADTPQKLGKLQTLTQRKLVAHPSEGTIRYVYADAAGCKCVYAGDEAAYQRYQELAVQERIADERLMTAQMNQDAAMDWGGWGPWYPYDW